MGDIITLPGAIPGLLRRGSPIIIDNSHRGLVWGEHLDTVGVVIFDAHEASRRLVSAERLALDLTDATGRAHAAWWLSAQAAGGARHDAAGAREVSDLRDLHPVFAMSAGFSPGQPCSATAQRHRFGGVAVRLDQCGPADWPNPCHHWCHIDHCMDLDPNDPALLPDGSRRVDAEALRRVVLHVAGLAPAPPRSEG